MYDPRKYIKGSYMWDKYFLQFHEYAFNLNLTSRVISSGPKFVGLERIDGYKCKHSHTKISNNFVTFGYPVYEI